MKFIRNLKLWEKSLQLATRPIVQRRKHNRQKVKKKTARMRRTKGVTVRKKMSRTKSRQRKSLSLVGRTSTKTKDTTMKSTTMKKPKVKTIRASKKRRTIPLRSSRRRLPS